MTRERLIKHWDCVVALRDGKTVQTLSAAGIWEDDPSPSFTDSSQHRVKPEPREVWVIAAGENLAPIGRYFRDYAEASVDIQRELNARTSQLHIVKFREVLE